MKCSKCGFENKDKAKFCTKCGNSLAAAPVEFTPTKSGNSKYIIIALIAVIIILAGTIGYFALNNNAGSADNSAANSQDSADAGEDKSVDVAKEEIITREKSEALRYMEIHNIDISNMDIYDIIINTGTFNPENVSEIIIQTLKVI